MMKKLALLLILAFAGVCLAFGQRVTPSGNSLRVNLLTGDKSTVTVRSIGNGTNEATCQEDAQKKAIQAVLFIGLSSDVASVKYQPLVTDKNEFDPYFQAFFNDQVYKRYITSSSPSSSLDKVKGQKQKEQAFDIVVNINSLETQLRKEKIIKSMGIR